MTKEQASLQELGTDAERLAAKTAAWDAKIAAEREAKVNAIKESGISAGNAESITRLEEGDKRARARRSDAGVPRPKPAAAPVQAGKLSAEQAQRFMDLLIARDTMRARWDAAIENEREMHSGFTDADAAVIAWFRENTAQ